MKDAPLNLIVEVVEHRNPHETMICFHMSSRHVTHERQSHRPKKQSRVIKYNHITHAPQSLGPNKRTREADRSRMRD